MSNELELDQKAIDELLATANKELSGLVSPSTEITAPQEPSITEKLITPLQELPLKNSTQLFIMALKQHFTKKIALAIFLLFVLFISVGAFLGFKMANHNIVFASRTPLEKLIDLGITFEGKNFVAYAGRGDKEVVNAFLDAGMSVNAVRPTDGWSPLMSACFYKKSDIVELLLEKQATVNLQDKYGKTALIHATVMGAEDIVTMLLEYGANPNIQDNNGRTPLIEAYTKKYARISEILKSAGANPNVEPSKTLKIPPQPPLYPTKKLPIEALPDHIAQENHLTLGKAGFVQIGMPLADIQKKYPSLTVSEKYIDGNKKTIANIYFNNTNSPSLELELSSGTLKLVSTISIYDEQFSTDKQITIKSTVGDIRNQYTINDIKVINNSLFLVVKSIKMLFELDLSKGFVPTEWLNTGNPTSIPDNTNIKRIVIY
ncbi:MAG: Ankyrin repeat-containing protein [Firmicutes bacterium]|nr:Ankyrin repeat-containing protein [Bacillota bacterium]